MVHQGRYHFTDIEAPEGPGQVAFDDEFHVDCESAGDIGIAVTRPAEDGPDGPDGVNADEGREQIGQKTPLAGQYGTRSDRNPEKRYRPPE